MTQEERKNQLTPKQEWFAREYCVDFNKTAAAERAGFSPSSAGQYGYELYNNPLVRARIKELLSERRDEYKVNEERLQKEVARIAFIDPTEIYEELTHGTIQLKNLKELPPRIRACIKTIRPTRYGVTIEFHDKISALEMLARHFGYFEKDNSQKALDKVQIVLPDNGRDNLLKDDLQEEGL